MAGHRDIRVLVGFDGPRHSRMSVFSGRADAAGFADSGIRDFVIQILTAGFVFITGMVARRHFHFVAGLLYSSERPIIIFGQCIQIDRCRVFDRDNLTISHLRDGKREAVAARGGRRQACIQV